MDTFIIITVICAMVILAGWSINSILVTAERDWATLLDLEEKARNVKTKEDIELLYKELVNKGSKIYNEYLQRRLNMVDGYLLGLYQQFKD